jgi:hypothetical protein
MHLEISGLDSVFPSIPVWDISYDFCYETLEEEECVMVVVQRQAVSAESGEIGYKGLAGTLLAWKKSDPMCRPSMTQRLDTNLV